MVFALILVVKLKRIVGDLRVHGGTEENCVVSNGMLSPLNGFPLEFSIGAWGQKY